MDLNKKLNTALLKAAADNSKEEVALLLDNPGVDVNAAWGDGRTALHIAASKGHLEVVVLLLKHPGVHVDAAAKYGYKALHCASLQGHLGVVALILEHPGIDVSSASNYGHTALHLAALQGHDGIVALLLDYPGVEVGATDKDGRTALHHCCLLNATNRDLLRRLLTNPDSDPNLKTLRGNTPLMVLLRRGGNVVDLLRAFMECDRVDLELKDQDGRSLEDLAR